MCAALDLLDRALALAAEEYELLLAGEVEAAAEKTEERKALIEEAWVTRDPVLASEHKEKLIALCALQDRLTEAAETQREAVRAELAGTRKESRRMAGYGNAVKRRPLHSAYVSKRG